MEPLLIGRKEERSQLEAAYTHGSSRFVAVFGRRRIGKTFLIRQTFGHRIHFQMTGQVNRTQAQQLDNFVATMQRQCMALGAKPKNWFFAFQHLIDFLEKQPEGKKVVFFDELPWLASKKSDFLSALEHFWNSWASARTDILLIVCGSSASWMVNQVLKNKGGLHNRVTDRIRLAPFTLRETEQFLTHNNPHIDRYSIVLLYMVLGGVPFYLEAVSGHLSADQNIERLCFSPTGLLHTEFESLLQALFQKHEQHQQILKALSEKNRGLTRKEIAEACGISNSGRLTSMLTELEQSDFIASYTPFGKQKRDLKYRLSDFYTAFYFKFLHQVRLLEEDNWLAMIDTGRYHAWKGFAFEQVCLNHIRQLRIALGIVGIVSQTSVWQNHEAQIDLLIDRKDRVINLFEIKFSDKPYTINQAYATQLAQKIDTFKAATKTSKTIHLTFLTAFGLVKNNYSAAMVQKDFSLDVLFE